MNNITDTDINQIRTIKSTIEALELSLDKFMQADLSDSAVRSDMRKVLNTISNMQDKLTNKLDSMK